jgi:hypothetical protein
MNHGSISGVFLSFLSFSLFPFAFVDLHISGSSQRNGDHDGAICRRFSSVAFLHGFHYAGVLW